MTCPRPEECICCVAVAGLNKINSAGPAKLEMELMLNLAKISSGNINFGQKTLCNEHLKFNLFSKSLYLLIFEIAIEYPLVDVYNLADTKLSRLKDYFKTQNYCRIY